MSNELATRNTSDLTIAPEQGGFTDTQLAALAQIGVDTNRPGDVAVFFHQAKRTGLDPFKREIYMITRSGKPTIQTGIDGFYKIATRAAQASGGTWGIPETLWCGEDGQWVDVWLSKEPPAAAKVTVERDGSRFTTVALTSEYKATGPLWTKMPARMIAKCAEALGIRKAFPDDLSGLYTSEEMQQADNPAQSQPTAQGGNGGSRIAQARQRSQQNNRPAPEATQPSEPMCTQEQWGKVIASLNGQGISDPGAQQQTVAEVVGRSIGSPQELTAAEAAALIVALDPTVEGEIVDEADAA